MNEKKECLRFWNWILPIITIVIVCCKQILLINIPDITIIGLCAVSFMLLPISSIYSYVAFAFLFEHWIPVYMIAFIAGFILLLKNRIELQLTRCYFWAIGFILIGVIAVILEHLDMMIYIKDSVSLLFLLYLFINVKYKDQGNVLAFWYMIGFVCMCILSVLIVSKYMNFSDAITLHRFGYDSLLYFLPSGVKIANENNIGRWAAIVTTLACLLKYKGCISVRFTTVICGFAFIFALLTQSRSGIGVIVLSYILVLFIAFRLVIWIK